MILQSLVDHYEALERRGEIAPPGWGPERVSHALSLSRSGELLGVLTLLNEETRGKKTVQVPQVMQVPERVVRAAGIKANFLCDNTMYLLGVGDNGKPERIQEAFAATKKLHLDILADVQCDAANALKAFFTLWQPENAAEHPALVGKTVDIMGTNMVFWVEGMGYAHEDSEIKKAWMASREKADETSIIRCLVTGTKSPARKLHGKIKGVPGAQTAGANLISYNARAFVSYEQEYAHIGQYAAFAHVTALNHLISRSDSYWQKIGDTLVLYWAEGADPVLPQVFSLSSGLGPPDPEAALSGIMERLFKGLPVDGVDMGAKFYILGIAPNAARLSVRFFLQNTFGAFMENLRAHYARLEIVRPAYDQRPYLTLPALMRETVNPNSRDKAASPLLSGSTLRAILTGGDYPEGLFEAVLLRVRAEQEVSRGKAAIIKAYLTKNRAYEEGLDMALNPQLRDVPYVLGRLFAVLERAQVEANPGINATIKDRYLGSACANPAMVFPQLLRLAGHHTAKVDTGKYRDREIGELMDLLEPSDGAAFPTQHTLAQQGMFLMGYYHQVQDRYKKKENR